MPCGPFLQRAADISTSVHSHIPWFPKGPPQTPTSIVATPKYDKLITEPSIISYLKVLDMPGNFIYLTPRVLSRSGHAFSSGSDFLTAPVQCSTDSDHLTTLVYIEVDTATWNRKGRTIDEERDWKSENRDWASTLNILVLLSNSTSPSKKN